MGWLESKEGTTTVREGLWYHCDYTGDLTCCQTLEDYLLYENNGVPSWIKGCRAFQIIGVYVGFPALFLIFLCTFIDEHYIYGTLKKICAGVNFCTFGVILISVIIYGSSYKQATWLKNPSLSGSFGVGLFLGICYFFQGILIVVAICSNKGNVNTKHITVAPAQDSQNNQGNRGNVNRVAPAPNSQIKQENFPSNWITMREDQNTLLVPLRSGSMEYTKIENEFRRTLGPMNVSIVRIDQIQIKGLYKQYQIAKDTLKKNLPHFQPKQIEKCLWHGTSAGTVESIVTYGFDRSYCGKNATMYGEGVYFALETAYSAQTTYSPPDDQGHSKMFRCMVLVGEYTVGDSTMRKPPVKKDHILYDSTVDDATSPRIFVVYNDAHAYPEHLITFKL